jgi:arylsulfatase A-like enzyme
MPPLVRMGRSEQFQVETLKAGEQVQPREIAHFRDLYDDEIAFFDEEFKKLIDSLEAKQLLDRSILIVASDHGEAFQEQNYLGHCRIPLFEAMTSTPLIMHIPGFSRSDPVHAEAQNLDITPTILDYVGFDVAGLDLDGVSLRPAIETDQAVNSHTFSIQGVEVTASDARRTLTYNLESGRQALFDRIEDPGHQHPLDGPEDAEGRALRQQLDAWLADRVRTEDADVARDARRLEAELRALGYIQSVDAPSGARSPSDLLPESGRDHATGE